MQKKQTDHLLRVSHNPEAFKKYRVKAAQNGTPIKEFTEKIIEQQTGIKFS